MSLEQASMETSFTSFFGGLIDSSEPVRESPYQKSLETKGWKFITNEVATNYLLGIDHEGEESLRNSLQRLKEDYQKKHPGKKIGLFRAYDFKGNRIPHPAERDFGFVKRDVTIVAIYTKETE